MNTRVRPLRVCVCTTYPADGEPRAPSHAAALAAALGKDVEVTFIDAAPIGKPARRLKVLDGLPNLTWQTHYYPYRHSSVARVVINRIRKRLAQALFRCFGVLTPIAFSDKVTGFAQRLDSLRADVYFTHTIEGLLPAAQVAKRRGALLMFDSMEFHSDMDNSQSELERAMVRAVETKWLSHCALVTASSDQVADELARIYRIRRPRPRYNVPTLEPKLPPKDASKFTLYWRNAVIGLGQRGLEDALVALNELPAEIVLHLQGHLPKDGGAILRARIAELGVTNRVFFHPPYAPEDAVKEAAQHTIGLCLERKGFRNHDLTVSNKMFDYHMAGLAVVSSNLESLRAVIERSGGGLLYDSGSAGDLARQVMTLYRDRVLLDRLAGNARSFALREGNLGHEMKRFVEAFHVGCLQDDRIKPSTYV